MTVNDLLNTLTAIQLTTEQIKKLKSQMLEMKVLEDRLTTLHSQLTEGLVRLDVVQRGNFGWENRTLVFLLELLKSHSKLNLVEKEAKHCPECNGTVIETTTMGIGGDVDSNRAYCHSCKWEGIVHDLVPEKKGSNVSSN